MKTYLYSGLVAMVFVLPGCKKYLEKLPDNRATLNSPEKVSELLVTAYPTASYMTFTEAMTDNVTDIGSGTAANANSDSYFWASVQGTNQDTPEYYWNACYRAIAAANQALDAIAKMGNPAGYQAQKGEALVARAYSHFMLVSLFAKMYDPASASSDMGIPYVTVPEDVVIKLYDRNTVQYVYDMIEKDLTEGFPLINERTYEIPKYHFTKQAAAAFAARFYLFKRDYAQVIDYAKKAFPAENWTDNMRPWLTTIPSLSSSTLIGQEIDKATTNANLLLSNTTSWWSRYYRSYRYATNATIYNLLRATNVTTGSFGFAWYSSSSLYYFIPKFYEYFVYSTATTGVGYVMSPLFITEEVLFNRAEAYIQTGKYTEAIADLNTWAKGHISGYNATTHGITEARVKTFYNTNDIKEGLIKTLLDFKRVCFLHEGMRWFDILRYKLPVVHRTTDGQELTLGPDDLRRVIQIPQEAASTGGLPLNPR